MKVSKSFLNEFIDIKNINYKELAEKMVFAGNEYESSYTLSDATNLVIGEVVECEKHPESKKLSICQVDYGEGLTQILCGAPNVRKGIKVIVAKVGAKLPGGIEIKKAKLAGMESNGMICSLLELGIESKYLTEEDKNGIHILPNDAKIGEDAIKYLGYDDEVIDFELTSNRGDLLSYLGMAYEVGAIYDLEVKTPEIECEEIDEDINDNYELNVETDNCSIYLGKLVKNIEIKESPLFIKNRLMASGIRSINNVVDISNYVMLEYGQPLHFFDAEKLGNKVLVRDAKKDEEILTLDGVNRKLNETDLVITDGIKPVALAGVMGGFDTEVTNDTKNIFIESAIFDSYTIRKTAQSILRSEASNRYEKGIDPNRTLLALKRACYLLNKYASGNVLKGVLTYDQTEKQDKKINITLEKINSVLGMELSLNSVGDIFRRLNFKYECDNNLFTVYVPTRRLDINIMEDLIEEVGRIYGYNNVKGILPTIAIKEGKRSKRAIITKNIKNHLQSLGLDQVITYSLIDENNLNKFVDHEFEPVKLIDPMSEDKKYMRNSLISSLLNVWSYNNARNIKNINIFETGHVYEVKNNDYIEENKVSGLLYGNYITNNWQGNMIKVDFYLLKGIIENLLKYLGFNNRYSFDKEVVLSDLHPYRSCSVKIDNEVIGYFGQVHPLINKKEIYVFELSIDKILSKKVRGIKYKEVSKYPSVNKDLAFIVKKDVECETVLNVIKKTAGRLLSNIDVFDIYEGDKLKSDEKSIAYSLTFQDPTRTLNDEEVMSLFNKIIENVETKVGAKLRNKENQ